VSVFTGLGRLTGHIDALCDAVGRWAAWLVPVVIALLFGQLPLREWVGGGHILANDFGQIAHAAVFMFGLSYALRWDRHIRMDVFYRRWSPRRQALVNLVGCVFFVVPWCGVMIVFGWSIMVRAVEALERFPETWSAGYFLFKVILILAMALVALQALAVAARAAVVLANPTERP